MRANEQVEFTNMCMIRDAQGRVVMQHRTGDWPGYALPGGHVEPGEPFAKSVIREVYEETGLTIEHPQLCGVKDWLQEDGSRYVVMLYIADHFSGELRSSDEGDVVWVRLDMLDQLPLASGMRQTMDIFLNDQLSEQWFDAQKDYKETQM